MNRLTVMLAAVTIAGSSLAQSPYTFRPGAVPLSAPISSPYSTIRYPAAPVKLIVAPPPPKLPRYLPPSLPVASPSFRGDPRR